jgi:endo-1,4-beta-D-glucanase Y
MAMDGDRPHQTGRRSLVAAVAGLAVAACPAIGTAGEVPSLSAMWSDFRRRFIAPDGRVVDTGNGGVSHSEGQGYGMLFAAQAGDQDAFRRILGFTRAGLRVRSDRLHAWRFDPRAATPVADRNNATDGDLGIAWGLLRGAVRWNDAELAREAQVILLDLFRIVGRDVAGKFVLLPGAFGFEGRAKVILNPSYGMFPAWSELRHVAPGLPWQRLEGDQLALLDQARFGSRGLPSDWVEFDRSGQDLTMPDRWPKRFSYDAIRVPLYLAWARHQHHPALRSAMSFWSRFGGSATPAWVELPTDRTASYTASPGMLSVRALAMADARLLASSLAARSDDYYSASLRLLCRMAADRIGVRGLA